VTLTLNVTGTGDADFVADDTSFTVKDDPNPGDVPDPEIFIGIAVSAEQVTKSTKNGDFVSGVARAVVADDDSTTPVVESTEFVWVLDHSKWVFEVTGTPTAKVFNPILAIPGKGLAEDASEQEGDGTAFMPYGACNPDADWTEYTSKIAVADRLTVGIEAKYVIDVSDIEDPVSDPGYVADTYNLLVSAVATITGEFDMAALGFADEDYTITTAATPVSIGDIALGFGFRNLKVTDFLYDGVSLVALGDMFFVADYDAYEIIITKDTTDFMLGLYEDFEEYGGVGEYTITVKLSNGLSYDLVITVKLP
jgi:hypothetical protein